MAKWNGPGVLRVGKREYKPGEEILDKDIGKIRMPDVQKKIKGREKKGKGGK